MVIELLKMSLGGGLLIALIALIRTLALRRLPKSLFPALWCLALLRLLAPVSIPVPAGLAVPDIPPSMGAPSPDPGLAAPAVPPDVPEGVVVTYSGTVSDIHSEVGLIPLIPAVWAAVGTALGVHFAVSWYRFRRELRTALPVEGDLAALWLSRHPLRRGVELRELEGLPSPLTYGVLRPVIVLPKGFDWSDCKRAGYVLYHEYTHIRRFDAALKVLMASALCVHWFNPLVWLMYLLLDRDIELACDEGVLRHYGADGRRDYAMTLIDMEERRSLRTPFGSFFGKNAAEERINAIMRYSKRSVLILIAVVLLAAAGTVTAFAMTARAREDEPPSEGPESGAAGSTDPAWLSGEPQVEGVRQFQNGDLKLTVSGVGSARRGCAWDGAEVWDYPVFVLEPGARMTVEDADEEHGWGFITLDDERLDLTDGMDPVELGSDAWCVYDRESSLPVLGFLTSDSDPSLHQLNSVGAVNALADQLARAYELTYGPLIPSYTKPEGAVPDDEYLAWAIPHLSELMTEDDGYYIFDVIFPFWVDKATGQIYKHYDGLDPYTIPFDPEDPNALSFAG